MSKNQKGFSLAEIMVAMGMMGVVALGTMQLTKNSMKSQKRFEASSEGQALFHTLNQQLLNSDACKNTLSPVGSLDEGTQISEIRNRENRVVFDTSRNVNKVIKIDSITVSDFTTTSGGFSEFNLALKFKRISSQISDGTKIVEYKIPIQAELKDGVVEKCYAHTDNAVASAKEQACKNISGVYNRESDMCDLKDYVVSETESGPSLDASNNVAVSTEYLKKFAENLKIVPETVVETCTLGVISGYYPSEVECTVACKEGYTLVGGGCGQNYRYYGGSNGITPMRFIRNIIPYNNTWRCQFTGEDERHGEGSAPVAYAVCLKITASFL